MRGTGGTNIWGTHRWGAEALGARKRDGFIDGPAIKIRQPQVAVEAQALGESFVSGGIEVVRQFLLRHISKKDSCVDFSCHPSGAKAPHSSCATYGTSNLVP